MSDESDPTSYTDLILAAAQLARGAECLPFALVPQGYTIRCTERLQEAPIRARRVVTLRTVESFLAFFKKFVATDGNLPGFYRNNTTSGLTVSIVFNPLTWGDSSATLNLRVAPALMRWLNLERSGSHKQKTFAAFIEENLADIVEPQGAKLLEVCRSFRATQTVRFASTVDLANGDVGLEYIQETKAGTVDAKSRLQVPENIVLGLPLFEGEERIKIKAKLLYAIDDGVLKLAIKFPQLDDAFDAVTADIIERVAKALPNVTFMDGEMPAIQPLEFTQVR